MNITKENLNIKKTSIIISCYNYAEFVGEAIESALSQTYKNIEVVVVNDGSTDNSSEVIQAYSSKYKNIIFADNKENRGVIYARNFGIQLCTGYYILPLDADDVIDSSYVQKAVKVYEEMQKYGFIYCKADFIGLEKGIWDLPKFDKEKIKYTNTIFSTALFAKKHFEEVGGYKENMKLGYEDWDLWLSFIEKGLTPYQIPEVLFHYRKHEISRNQSCLINEIKSLRNIFKNHLDYYINDDEFIKKVFRDYSKDLCDEYLKLYKNFEKSYMKYKKLFNIFLVFFITEFVVILLLVYFYGFKA